MRQKVILGLLILVTGSGIFSIVYAVVNPDESVFSYISGLAVVVLAILTMTYVYITSRQLDVMGGQLKQMETESRLENQPLPYVQSIDVKMEKPSLFYTPQARDNPHYPYHANTRYWVKPKIRNIGSHPAVCVDVSARIEILREGKEICLPATSISIPTIAENEEYPDNEVEGYGFLFADDWEGTLVEALRELVPDRLPILSCRILFRNILGGCFVGTCKYRLFPEKKEDDALFVEWLSGMKSFWVKYKDEMEKLKSLHVSDIDKWDKEFNKLDRKFMKSMKGGSANLFAWTMPGSFAIKSISMEEYQKEVGDIAYDVKLGKGLGEFAFPKGMDWWGSR